MRAFRAVAAVLFLLLAGAVWIPPAGAATKVTVSGVVDAGHGNLQQGSAEFYSSCDPNTATREFVHIQYGTFTTEIPVGQYRVRISGETTSWHDAQATCETATVLTFTEDTYVTLRAIPLFVVTGTVTTKRGSVTWGAVKWYADCQAAEVALGSITRGSFSVKVPPGDYHVRVVPGQRIWSAADSWHAGKPACADSEVIAVTGDQALDVVGIAKQHVAMRQPRTVRAGIKRALPAKTGQGVRVQWTAKPKRVCSILHRNILKTRKKGVCRLSATAPAAPGLAPYAGLFAINVYEPRGMS